MENMMQLKNFERIKRDQVIYELNKQDKEADIIGNEYASGDIFIPRSIIHESHEFIITRIRESSFESLKGIKSIQFSSNSQLKIIEREAFASSELERINLPASVTYIGERAFYNCSNLRQVDIPPDSQLKSLEKEVFSYCPITSLLFPSNLSELKLRWSYSMGMLETIKIVPNNKYFFYLDDKMIIGKTDANQDEFDELVFVRRNCNEIVIPSFIKRISSYAFSFTSIKNIIIPSQVIEICDYSFALSNLENVEFEKGSKLYSIGKKAFFNETLLTISIPSSVCELKDGWFKGVKLNQIIIIPNGQKNISYYGENDSMIIGKSNIDNDEYDNLIFVNRDVENVTIPPFIKQICAYSFSFSVIERIEIPSSVITICKSAFVDCINLEYVEIPANSELKTIEKYAFSNTSIQSIKIPCQVTKIGKEAFASCDDFTTFEVAENSKLQTIESSVFSETSIEKISIPSCVSEFKDGWCFLTPFLTKINIFNSGPQNIIYYDNKYILGKTDSTSDIYDVLIFARCDLESAKIPPFIKKIESNAFSGTQIQSIFIPSKVQKICSTAFLGCVKLKSVIFPEDSELQMIEEGTFTFSAIESINIPKNVTRICKGAFNDIATLRSVNIPSTSKLKIIEKNAFMLVPIESIYLPPYISQIDVDAFYGCSNLQIIEFDENFEMPIINKYSFKECPNVILMIPKNLKIFIQ